MTEEQKEPQGKTIRVRIQDDGTSRYGTKVTDVETGASIDDAFSAIVTMRAGHQTQVQLSVYAPVVDIIADAEVRHIRPACGRENEVPREYQENKTVPLSVRVAEEIGKAFSWLDKHGDLTHD